MQTINTRLTRQANYKLNQYKKKNKLNNKSEAIEQLLASQSLVDTRSENAEEQKWTGENNLAMLGKILIALSGDTQQMESKTSSPKKP